MDQRNPTEPPEEHGSPGTGSAPIAPDASLLAAMLEGLPMGVLLVDSEGRIQFANRGAARLFGLSAAKLIGGSIELLFPGVGSAYAKELAAALLADLSGPDIATGQTLPGVNSAGAGMQVHVVGSPVTTATGPLMQLSMQLASDGDLAESALARMVDLVPDAVVMADVHGRIRMVNGAALRLFGYHRDELLFQPVEVLIPESLRAEHVEHRHRYMMQGESRLMGVGRELRALRKDGTSIPVEVALCTASTPGGDWVSAAIRDLCAKQQTEGRLSEYIGELEVRNRDLERFAALASHDLQAPLRSIAEFSKLVAEELQPQGDGRLGAYLTRIVTSAERLRSLVADLLRLSRIGNEAFVPEPVALPELLLEVQESMREELSARDARVLVDDLPTIHGDPVLLATVFRNLLSNSIKFQREDTPPRIEIESQRVAGGWEFVVSDNGIGIEAKWLEQVFLAFQRLHSKDRYPGNGLGLAICRKIVEEVHGGRMCAEVAPGGGTRIRLMVPDQQQRQTG